MRLASFVADGKRRFGLSPDQKRIYDLTPLLRSHCAEGCEPRSMLDFIESGSDVWAAARALQEQLEGNPDAAPQFRVESVQFLAPVTKPSKICCVALNNSANSERILSGPKHPAVFLKAANSLIGHRDQIRCRPFYGHVHPEPELAVVIGRQAKDVALEDAYDYVFGYTVHNDITSPTMRAEDTFHYRAIRPKNGNMRETEYVDTWVSYPGRYKGSDTFACMGPWLVTRDEVPDPHNLAIECWHDDELVTADNTANLFYKIPKVLSFLSRYMTLLPGDIISMGTALKASTGNGRAVQNINLGQSNTRVSVSIEGIGTLENTSTLEA